MRSLPIATDFTGSLLFGSAMLFAYPLQKDSWKKIKTIQLVFLVSDVVVLCFYLPNKWSTSSQQPSKTKPLGVYVARLKLCDPKMFRVTSEK